MEKEYEEQERNQKMRLDDALEGVASLLGMDITSSLLSNLLDVMEEVQLARIEIRNLVQAKFYSQSVGQLDLLLSFVDLNTGRKLKVILDMTCLKCGVYPMEILPSHIYELASGEQKSLPELLEAKHYGQETLCYLEDPSFYSHLIVQRAGLMPRARQARNKMIVLKYYAVVRFARDIAITLRGVPLDPISPKWIR
ncbi:uncharacterized protein G2W53_018350 [Senna tora]|uniref:Uncharacterized protein n=1 Tax=Senna tora TaxID=362788 RepID=A0A834TUW5_9FABA|nr:uncharacterized protein G2W53_018350 [Senna tora]